MANMDDIVKIDGTLVINTKTGTIQFMQYGYVLLNITHLKLPMPPNRVIEIAAIEALTSYTPRNYRLDEDESGNHHALGHWEDSGPEASKTPE